MSEQAPLTPETAQEVHDYEPRLERAADFVNQEIESSVGSAVRISEERGGDPTYWQKATRRLKRNMLATTLALTTVAGMEGMRPQAAEAGDKGRKIARIGAIILGDADRAMEEAYYRNIEHIRDLSDALEQNRAEQERIVAYYEQLARRIVRATRNVESAEQSNNTTNMREAMEYRQMLRDEQAGLRERLRSLVAFERIIEARLGSAEKSASKKRAIGAITGTGSRILEILSRGY
jgi:hypothetical protein